MRQSLQDNDVFTKEMGVEQFSPKINKCILGNKTHRSLIEPSLTQHMVHFDKSLQDDKSSLVHKVHEEKQKDSPEKYLKKQVGKINPSMQPFRENGKTFYP